MDYELAQVELQDIIQDDHAFRISTTRDKSSLHGSINTIGLLIPPALRRDTSGLTIVSGFRRIHACQEVGIQILSVRLLPDDLKPLDCLRLAVTENISQRPLNLIETTRAIQHLKKLCPHDQAFSNELAMLGLPASRGIIDKLDRLGHLSFELQTAVTDGVIGLDMALSIGKLPPPEQFPFLAIFTQIRMSVSKQRDILTMVKDIAGRDRKTVCEVLQSHAIRAIVDDNDLDRNMKTAAIRLYLKQVRYPNLAKAEANYQAAVRSLKLGSHIRIDPPVGFEGTTYTLSLRFRNHNDLNAAHQKLGAALENPATESLFPK